MIEIINKANVEGVSAAYPHGSIKDDLTPGDGTGTPVNRLVYSDMHQFFSELMTLSGVVPNNLPDNFTNGFQLIQALNNYILIQPGYSAITYAAGVAVVPGFNVLRFKKDKFGVVHLGGSARWTGAVGAALLGSLPAGSRPNLPQRFVVPFEISAGSFPSVSSTFPWTISINSSGQIVLLEAQGAGNHDVWLDSIQFPAEL